MSLNDEVSFGDICTTFKQTDIEDIFINRNYQNKHQIDYLKRIVKKLVKHEFKNRNDYVKISRNVIRNESKALNKGGKKMIDYPSKVDLNINYKKLLKKNIINRNLNLEKYMRRKFGRSGSGELPITVFTSPSKFDCPQDCFYCPDEKKKVKVWNKKHTKKIEVKKRVQPRSYLSTEPGCMRAAKDNFHPVWQTWDRIQSLEVMGHEPDKIRLIVLGGTYCYYPLDYRIWFITSLYYACNTYNSWEDKREMKSLKEEMITNRTSDCRIVGITIETRPDNCTLEDCAHFMSCGITTVQLGIQQVFDDILKGVNRKCTVKQIKEGCKRILDCGIKLDTHYMFDLPGPNKVCRLSPKTDKAMIDIITNNPDFAVADQWKLYPCSTTPHTRILKWYNNMLKFMTNLKEKCNAIKIQNFIRYKYNFKYHGQQIIDISKKKYLPYAEIDNGSYLMDVLLYAIQKIHKDTRLNRVIRDIPETSIVGGNKCSNLRQEVAKEIIKRGLEPCKCIRCREIQGGKFEKSDIHLDIYTRFKAGSNDHFLSFEDKNGKIYGLARLRFLNKNSDSLPILKGNAIIRELHVYGATVKVNNKDSTKPQHSGLGKQLLKKCEEMAINNGYSKIFITSGEGVIKYYEKRGYKIIYSKYKDIEYHYMVKNLHDKLCLKICLYLVYLFSFIFLIQFIMFKLFNSLKYRI